MGGAAAEGMYRLELLDHDKVVHPHLVSREVFAPYQVGDDFDAKVALDVMVKRNFAKRERAKAAAKWAQLRSKRHREVATVAHLSLLSEMMPGTEAF